MPGRRRARTRLLSGRSLVKHTVALTARYARTFWRDRRTLAILIGQAPVMAALIALLYPAHAFALPDHQPTRSAQLGVFARHCRGFWLGLIDSCREIVKERTIVLRELVVGVRLDAYLLSKAGLLLVLAAVQCALLVAVAAVIQPLHHGLDAYLALGGLLVLTSWSTVALGLVVSTLARSVDQATSSIPLLLIPQLLFGGALVPFARMGAAIKVIADLMVSRWAFAGAGHAIDMNARLADAPRISALSGYGTKFFSLNEGIAAAILIGATAALLLLAAAILADRSAHRELLRSHRPSHTRCEEDSATIPTRRPGRQWRCWLIMRGQGLRRSLQNRAQVVITAVKPRVSGDSVPVDLAVGVHSAECGLRSPHHLPRLDTEPVMVVDTRPIRPSRF